MEKLHQQWDVIENMYYYQFESILKSYAKIVEDRNAAEEEEMKKSGYDSKKYNPESLMNQAQKNIPKMSMQKMEIPKF